ncbi:hypothetical protein K1X13_11710 [Nocardioides sp. WL0053]|uniref:DUF2231 domain-containing protein n=1 Tax=Nocardioides jiangsuensis TaxID=2866161 RepID=A0ABS7RPL1_9ACTN|nr:DUF2231 domain-containing protein [Nocardioides jiangsuensis]MBY9075487.1 hypothetical protein [Nocardioides jiangsuensis]
MFDLVNGLPIHPLVVHAVVVLLPLACLGTIALVVRPAWRRPYGLLVVADAALSAVLIPVATSSGEALESHVGEPGAHAELGEQLLWFALPLLVLSAALVWLDRRPVTRRGASSPRVVQVVAVLALVAAVAASVQVYRVGDSGARAAWADQVTGSAQGGE